MRMANKALSLAAVACLLLTAVDSRAAGPTLQVVSFTGELKILTGNSIIVLKPGSPGFSLPPGSDVTILGGEALLMSGGAMIKAEQDDRFIFLTGDGRPLPSVQAGLIEITEEGRTKSYGPGQLAALGRAAPAVAPQPPAPDVSPVAEVPPPAPTPVGPSIAFPEPPPEPSSSRLKVQIGFTLPAHSNKLTIQHLSRADPTARSWAEGFGVLGLRPPTWA